MDLDLEDFRLADVVQESVDLIVGKATDTQIGVHAEIEKGLGTVHADKRRIRQVLFNLLSNAMRFTEPGGDITVSASRVENMAILSVRDTGKGIDAEHQASSFDSFTSSDQRGAGLGLALVKNFVDLHGGNVGIKSTPGGGTEVVCWLPVTATVNRQTDWDIAPARASA